MKSQVSNEFLTHGEWLRAVAGGKDVILRYTSALEYLQLFGGYLKETMIDVYAKEPGEHENIDYMIADSFDGIDYFQSGNVLCTTADQTVNDMLEDFENIDDQSFIEGLSCYYYTHDKSFAGLNIKPENIDQFNEIKDWAIEYYDEV